MHTATDASAGTCARSARATERAGRSRSWERMTRTNKTRNVAVGTVKKSIDAHCDRCVRRNVRQVGEGDGARRPISVVGKNDEDKQNAERCRWDGEEVHRCTLRQMRPQERAPGRRGRRSAPADLGRGKE